VPVRIVTAPEQHHIAWDRYDARPGTAYLLRPDQHVCARWRRLDPARVEASIARATGHT
jgi:3-(3-hydroxy-phenyl)propionate hydroxylase